MSVVIETTIGDITVDLFLKERPRAALNFLKLCKLKYYNYNLFHTIQSEFIAQTGDPTGAGDGGMSIWGILEGDRKRYFEGESVPKIKHSEPGLLSMVNAGEHLIGSQFFFTLGADLTSLDGQHTVIGEVTEGHEVLRKLNEVICDERHRPYKDVRITHTVVLDDPFEDPRGFREPSRSPSPSAERLQGGRIAADEEIDDLGGKTEKEIAELIAEREAKARATILEIVGDIPDANIAPPENVLFVCKLNPVTTDDDLQIIFSRFGKIKGCEVIRDKVTGDSLQYAFIEFENQKSCEDAYFKMDNVLIDDRRIHVDFSQSVSKVKWRGKGRGIEFQDGADKRSFKDFDRKQQNRNGGSNKRPNASPKRDRVQEKQYNRSESRSRSRSASRSRPAKDDRRQRSRSRERMQHRERDRNLPQGRRDGQEGGRGRKPLLTERNSSYLEQRNGRDIRINQGKVDYKNRPYPNSFVQRKGPREKNSKRGGPMGGGRSGSGIRHEPPPRRWSRSRSRERRMRRSRSRSRDRRHSPERYRSQRSDSREARGRRQTEPERVGSRSSPSQQRSEVDYRRSGGGAGAAAPKPVLSGSRDPDQRRESNPPKRRSSSSVSRSSPPPKEKRKRKNSSSRSSSSDSSPPSSTSESDERTKKRKKKSSKKKSKSSRKRKGSDSSDGEKTRKKSKSKKKKRKH
ncbi:peptidyl-prolyl cis-trans isomerase sig-7 [Anopheles maculipalpis]|uniref:peptidyl-prolyl cis-trans isomerase sig-7 n=1 Tax=Anopheles maculipalpis TaxID=1496333 RepID=UPI002158CD86|nr:peptidyl-prolyl cis-trans isomerase sig-7 [Anopheles maculipalpis]